MRKSRKPDAAERRLIRFLMETRKSLKISQGELARHLDISAQQLGKVERGENRLALGRFVAAMEFLKTAVPKDSALLFGFAETEQALYGTHGDDRIGEVRESIATMRYGLDQIESLLLRILKTR